MTLNIRRNFPLKTIRSNPSQPSSTATGRRLIPQRQPAVDSSFSRSENSLLRGKCPALHCTATPCVSRTYGLRCYCAVQFRALVAI
ncbi:hypothetical protein [Tortoise microvirus 80]|nr:hypothetical protein [Tortoise microvirus 80]